MDGDGIDIGMARNGMECKNSNLKHNDSNDSDLYNSQITR